MVGRQCVNRMYRGRMVVLCLPRRTTVAIGLLLVRRWPLHGDLQITGAFGAGEFCTMENQIPALPGAYLLLIELTKLTDVKLSKMRSASLVPGRYIYAGSAYGPGGLKARTLPTHATNQSGTVAHRPANQDWHVRRLDISRMR